MQPSKTPAWPHCAGSTRTPRRSSPTRWTTDGPGQLRDQIRRMQSHTYMMTFDQLPFDPVYAPELLPLPGGRPATGTINC
jgi:hypothetical protein